ncbi:MAG: RNA polymerase sigma factor [Bacteroidota bacterium]
MDLKNNEQVRELIRGCKKGDRQSQRMLYEAFYGKMLGVCMRYSRDSSEAKDMVQEGFIKVFDKIKSYKHKGSLEGWIKKLIINNTIDYLRKNKKMKMSYEEESDLKQMKDEKAEDDEYKSLLKLQAETIVRLIQKLSPAYQTVFNLYVVEDLSHAEIADKLGISAGTSKSNFAKAKEKLREFYHEENERYDR